MMGDNGTNDSLALDDEDRLPWLEPAYGDDGEEEVSLLRLGGLIFAGLALLGLIVGGIYLLRSNMAEKAEPQVLAAPNAPYKVPAKSADAKKFQGEGDESYAASEGQERSGVIDPSRLPEAPIAKTATADVAAALQKASPAVAAPSVVVPVAKLGKEMTKAASASSPAPAPASSGSGPMIQLGAYGSEALAKSSWARLAKRFDYLGALNYSIQPVTVNGTQLYRLRAATGQAGILCGKLKVAGETCMVVN